MSLPAVTWGIAQRDVLSPDTMSVNRLRKNSVLYQGTLQAAEKLAQRGARLHRLENDVLYQGTTLVGP
jgi:hypothetical protein